MNSQHYFPTIYSAYTLQPPSKMRIPFGCSSFIVSPDNSFDDPILIWSDHITTEEKPISLRFSIALDIREALVIEAVLADSGTVLGSFDIKYAPVHQIQSIYIESKFMPFILEQGIKLRMIEGESPFWILSDCESSKNFTVLLPHIVVPRKSSRLDNFFDRLFSLDSIQQFEWMEGCVLDSLFDFTRISEYSQHAIDSLNELLSKFLVEDQLIYENPRSEKSDDTIYGVECPLPFAVISEFFPNHSSIGILQEYWRLRYFDNDFQFIASSITTEGSYTEAYPMIVVGLRKNDLKLVELGIKFLRLRLKILKVNNAIYQIKRSNGDLGFRNWARGIAWYLLGLARSLVALKPEDRPLDLIDDFQNTAEWIVSYQLYGGLWRCFIDEPGVRIDTSGSAGIAASLAIGVKNNLLSQRFKTHSTNALEALKDYLTDDGLLTGAAQSNRAGESLQRGDYRVIYQMGMGLMGQLIAALFEDDS